MSHVTSACPEELNEAQGRGRTYISVDLPVKCVLMVLINNSKKNV